MFRFFSWMVINLHLYKIITSAFNIQRIFFCKKVIQNKFIPVTHWTLLKFRFRWYRSPFHLKGIFQKKKFWIQNAFVLALLPFSNIVLFFFYWRIIIKTSLYYMIAEIFTSLWIHHPVFSFQSYASICLSLNKLYDK